MEENIKQLKIDILKHFDEKATETQRHFDEKATETQRHFNVVAERLEDKIVLVSEQVASNTETLETIKLDIEVIKNDLKQKVGRDEFVILERRVSLLEAKQR